MHALGLKSQLCLRIQLHKHTRARARARRTHECEKFSHRIRVNIFRLVICRTSGE